MKKEYIFTYSIVVEADNEEEAKDEFMEVWETSKDYLDKGASEVDLFTIHEEAQ